MSRIGKKAIPLPAGVTASIEGTTVTVKGPKGSLTRTLPQDITLRMEGGEILVERPSEATRHKALHGLSRTLVANMVEGVSKGYVKALELQGVGYKAESKPYGVNLVVGLSHQVAIKAPDGIKLICETPTLLKVEGINKEGALPNHPLQQVARLGGLALVVQQLGPAGGDQRIAEPLQRRVAGAGKRRGRSGGGGGAEVVEERVDAGTIGGRLGVERRAGEQERKESRAGEQGMARHAGLDGGGMMEDSRG